MNIQQSLLLSQLGVHFNSEESTSAILNKTKFTRIKKGDILIRQGASCSRIGIIDRGIARWYQENEGQSETVLQFFGEGDFITAPFSFFNGEPAHGTIQALEDLDIYYITRQDFDEIGAKYPDFLTISYRILSEIMMQFWSEKNKLLGLTAVDRYLFFQDRYAKIAHRISLGNISAYLGIRQSSLSRVRREISQKGW